MNRSSDERHDPDSDSDTHRHPTAEITEEPSPSGFDEPRVSDEEPLVFGDDPVVTGHKPRRPRRSIPRRFRGPAVGLAGAAAAIVIAVVASTLSWQPAVVPDRGVVSSSPSSSGAPSTPQAPPTDRPPMLAYSRQAELTAGAANGPVVALDSDFRLASLDGSPAAELATRLSVKPALDLAVDPEADGTAVHLRPAAPLRPGIVYRFTLAGTDGRPVDSWAFQAKQGVQVATTVPGNTETDVPLDTGIEITFDQDGVVDPASHVVIRPTTEGRFEQHGRTLAFIPKRLKAATVYTVTVRRGVEVSGTKEAMEEDFSFRFETAAKAGTTESTFAFPNEVLEVPTAGRADLAIFSFTENEAQPKTARIEVYRLGGINAAIDAYRQLRGSARWARWSSDDAVSTTGLRRVMAFTARLQRGGDTLWFRLPDTLAAGWYLVQRPSPNRTAQVVLQVTDVAGYLTVSKTRTLVWANDLANGRALVRARVTIENGELGRTDDTGLLLADTPASLRAESTGSAAAATPYPVVTVAAADGRSMFMPAISRSADGKAEWDASYGHEGSDAYWLVHHTDRIVYRRTDTINVWGVIRDRATGVVPGAVDVQLLSGGSDPSAPPIATFRSKPGPTGAFKGSLGLRDLPEGSYDVVLRVGTAVVSTIGVEVDRLIKPAYRLEVTTGRRVYIQGDRIKVTSTASFYEGSPVPGVPLRIGGSLERDVTTDSTGTATYRTTARMDPDSDRSGFEQQSYYVAPARAEEGDIAGVTREFVVFPSTRTIDAEATIRGGRVRVSGKVHLVDRDRLETALQGGSSPWDVEYRGRPVGGATVALTFFEQIPNKTQIGTQYDWIEKKVVPVYDYDILSLQLRTIKVRTAADGSFSTSIRDRSGRHDYFIRAIVGDRDGHTSTTTSYASPPGSSTDQDDLANYANLQPTDPADELETGYAIGDAIDLTFHENRPTAGGRYLFEFAQRGLRAAVVQRSSRLSTHFQAWSVPNVSIRGVHFNGRGYVEADGYNASFRAQDRAVEIGLTTNRARYAPGEEVTLEVRTRDRSGKAIPAAVVVQAVDAKLYAMGAVADADPLRELYGELSSGIVLTFASHRSQPELSGEGGDTTGGGEEGDSRSVFRDAVLFDLIQTGADGRGRTTFRLSDDLTSWRVSAAAVTQDLGAGSSFIDVPVGLPFFVDASIAPEYLTGDRPSIQVRTYGSALAAGAGVRITVTSDSLGRASRTVRAKAFETVTVGLPRLTAGLHTVTISASSGSGASAVADKLTRSFSVIDSRLERTRTAYVDAIGTDPIAGGSGLTTIVVSDASARRYLPLLLDIAAGEGARLERALAAAMASSLLSDRYGAANEAGPASEFSGDIYQTQDGGIAPVPYAGNDLQLTALVAIVAPERFQAGRLRGYLESILGDPKSTREGRVYAIAGLAGLGAPVLPQVQAAAADPQLTIRERLITGLGAAAIGDTATARGIATSLWEAYGEQVAGVARLRVGDSAGAINEATSLMAVLSASTGDARAPALWAYVEQNPSDEAPYELYAVAYVGRLIDRLPVEAASFAYVIDGRRTVVELERGDTFQLALTAAQRASLRIEPLAGSIGLTSTWREPVAAASLKVDPDISVSRTRTPAAMVRSSDLVRIDLTVRFGPKAPAGCHQVTELVPSGLVPMGPMSHWEYDDEGELVPPSLTSPYAVVGQRVLFCAEPTKKQPTIQLRYYARVISPGTYVWQPAVVESRTAPDRAALTREATVTIR
jgi:alpha-2-macroglobulin